MCRVTLIIGMGQFVSNYYAGPWAHGGQPELNKENGSVPNYCAQYDNCTGMVVH